MNRSEGVYKREPMHARREARRVVQLFSVLALLPPMMIWARGKDAEAYATVPWSGTADALSIRQAVVERRGDPVWRPGAEWRVIEEFRIGSAAGSGPEAFGRVESFDVDRSGRIWVLDGYARQVFVFDTSGAYVQTVGRRGAGPGEFREPVDIDLAPDGTMWVVDVANNRISAFSPEGEYLEGRRIPTASKMWPWWGGFDDQGRYYAPVPASPSETETVAYTLVRHDASLTPRDTLERPVDPVRRDVFEYRGSIAPVPFQGTLRWRLSGNGTVWALLTDEYRLFQLSWAGDTLRTIRRSRRAIPVSQDDLEQLRSTWAREIERDGIPKWWSRLPKNKPPATGLFFVDDERNVWVERQPENASEERRTFDVFDGEGRYLGVVHWPFAPRSRPSPIVRQGKIYAVTFDELDVPYLVKLRILKD